MDNNRVDKMEMVLELVNDKRYGPFKRDEMLYFLSVPRDEKHVFYGIIDELENSGKIFVTGKGKLMPANSGAFVTGTFLAARKGFGFVRRDETGTEDIFVSEDSVNNARHMDRVICKVTELSEDGARRAVGVIVKILERGFDEAVGVYEQEKGAGFVYPDDGRIADKIRVSKKYDMDAVTGHKVCVEIIEKKGQAGGQLDGRITRIIGHRDDPGIDILSVLAAFEIETEFGEAVLRETAALPDEVDLNGRVDLRGEPLITIDGSDAKDLDDAVSVKELGNGNIQLGVHIADVAHYVKAGSAIDREALRRGTSVYVPGRVVPMLPRKLSNGICSLNAGVDRLALSCVMEIDSSGDVVSHELFESVINVKERMTYDAAAALLETDENLRLMAKLSRILRAKRMKRGALDFSFAECKITVDGDGKAVDVRREDRNAAMGIIEEFMLVCNETIAECFHFAGIPFVYRIHERPDEAKVEFLMRLMTNLGISYTLKGRTPKNKAGDLTVHDLQALLSSVEGTKEEALVHKMALRSMKQARYLTSNTGHYGLAAKYYCHFTSPIRRYPDLQIHRIIKESLNSYDGLEHYGGILPEVCGRCSLSERIAEEAEREISDMKKAEFMLNKVGEIYTGVVSGIVSRGMFVELPNTVEGMVPVESLPERYVFDEQNMRLVAVKSNKVYSVGDEVEIVVLGADTGRRKVSFGLA